ncbi:MAG: ParB/RepB/Spo0J family partition protein, partial [Phenylobacterium sp.]
MAESRRGLGRGLSALLGEEEAAAVAEVAPAAAAASGPSVREAPIELLKRNPDQPRWIFPEDALQELADSIREKGILQPILVRPLERGEFEIVAGERRWRAAQKAGLKVVPVLVRELSDIQVLEIGVIENVQRADLSAIEEATAYKQLMDWFGRTLEAVAEAVGKSRS